MTGTQSTPTASIEARARAYSRGNDVLYFTGQFWLIAILLILVAGGVSARMRDRARRFTRRQWLSTWIYFADFAVAVDVLFLPFLLYADYFRERAWGFEHQTLLQWFGDWAKGLGLMIVVGGVLVALAYGIIRKFPRGWWAGISAGAILVVILSMAVSPLLIAPLFNHFTPLPAGPLRSEILNLAQKEGIPATEIYQVNASRQSGHTNAYMTGLFGTRRIVLEDTLLKNCTPREILAIVGHEMGHYKRHHVAKEIVFSALLIVVGIGIVRSLFGRLTARHGKRWGFSKIGDPAGLPLAALILAIYAFLLTPAINAFSRHLEHEADLFSLQTVNDPGAMIAAFRKFETTDLSEIDPPPFIEFWIYSHPSLLERIELCETWKRKR